MANREVRVIKDVATMLKVVDSAYETEQKLRAELERIGETVALQIHQIRALERELGQYRVNFANLQAGRDDDNKAACTALCALLRRPNRVLEIYGQTIYQVAKDVYASIGGDVTVLPIPEQRTPVEQPVEDVV